MRVGVNNKKTLFYIRSSYNIYISRYEAFKAGITD